MVADAAVGEEDGDFAALVSLFFVCGGGGGGVAVVVVVRGGGGGHFEFFGVWLFWGGRRVVFHDLRGDVMSSGSSNSSS